MPHFTHQRLITTALLLTILLGGCGKHREPSQPTVLREDEKEFVLMIVFDLSGSFIQQMAEDGEAYDFAMRVVDRYHREKVSTPDKLVLAQISGTGRSLLWEGTPLQLRRQFPTAAQFREHLIAKADPHGSFVNDGLAHAIQYVATDPRVTSGQAQVGVFVLSDMLDNGPNPEESKQRLTTALSNLGRIDHSVVGLYYVDQLLVAEWRQQLQDAGVKNYRVESEIVGQPNLPEFE